MKKKSSKKFLTLLQLPEIKIWNQVFTKYDVISEPKNRGKYLSWFTLVWDPRASSYQPPTIIFYSSQSERDDAFHSWKNENVDHYMQMYHSKIPFLLN